MTPTDLPQAAPITQLRALASDHLARLAAEWEAQRRAAEAERRERQEAERLHAVHSAQDHIGRAFPDTLARVLSREDWQGYPSVDDYVPPRRACAVAYLGEGVFAHHTRRQLSTTGYYPDVSCDEVTLLRPCPCGNYCEDLAEDQDALAVLVEQDQQSDCTGSCTPPHEEVQV